MPESLCFDFAQARGDAVQRMEIRISELLQQLWHVGIIVFLSLSLSLFPDLHVITVVGMNFFVLFFLDFFCHGGRTAKQLLC